MDLNIMIFDNDAFDIGLMPETNALEIDLSEGLQFNIELKADIC